MAVVTTLLRAPSQSWTGRELARAAGVTPRAAIQALRLLEQEGAVAAQDVPPSTVWRLRQEHLLVALLRPVTDMDGRARAVLLKELKGLLRGLPVDAAILFGSAAEARESMGSDLDLLVVVAAESMKQKVLREVLRRGFRVSERLGNPLAPIVLSRREFVSRRSHGFVKEAMERGIWVKGAKHA